MSTPRFQQHDIVYLSESAKVGFIESYEVSGIRQDASGRWMYLIMIPHRPSAGNATYGDRITLRQNVDFELSESELTTYCEAVDLALVAARSTLARIQALKNAQCADGSSGDSL